MLATCHTMSPTASPSGSGEPEGRSPLASFRGQAAAAGVLAQAHWTSLGARARVVIPTSGNDQTALEVVRDADVIVPPGGVPNRLVNALRGTPILETSLARWEAGAGVTGSSAGAIDLFEHRLNLCPPIRSG